MLNEAAIACAKDGRSFISQEDVDKSFIKLGIGKEKKSRIVSEHDRKITAYHEAGHAILFHVLPDVGPVHIVSIIPTGSGAGGYTMPISEKDDMYLTKGKMLQDITVSLGGRIAESLVLMILRRELHRILSRQPSRLRQWLPNTDLRKMSA